MDKPIIERDVVLIGKTEEGNDTFDFPVTRLGNIENDAEVKEKPTSDDYIPVIDSAEKGQMKKTPYVPIENQTPNYTTVGTLAKMIAGEKLGVAFGKIAKAVDELISHLSDNIKHVTTEERNAWNGKANGTHTHDERYYTESEIDSKLSGKSNKSHTHNSSEITGLPTSLPANGGNADTVDNKHASDFALVTHNHSAASQSAAGFMSTDDKKKLDGIAAGANAYTHPSYTARTGVPTANQTPDFGGTFSISQLVSDASGHVTGMNSRTVKIPNTEASDSKSGLMSAADKSKLDGLGGYTLKSVQKYSLGTGYAYPVLTIPNGAKYFILIFKYRYNNTNGYEYFFTGMHDVDYAAYICTGNIGKTLYEVQDSTSHSSSDYIIAARANAQIQIGACTGQTANNVIGEKICKPGGGTTQIEIAFF